MGWGRGHCCVVYFGIPLGPPRVRWMTNQRKQTRSPTYGYMRLSIKKRLQSFIYAFRGIVTLVKTQHNAWIHLFATLGVISFGFHFGVSEADWSLLIVAIIIVWLGEALNTAVEFLADSITREHHPLIGKAKDVAAGGVLVASIGAAAIGIIVFWPYVSQILGTKS